MNPALVTVIALRAAALAATLAGRPAQANALYAAADLLASGQAVDAHLQLVADKLAERELTEEDWNEVRGQIQADAARLHSG